MKLRPVFEYIVSSHGQRHSHARACQDLGTVNMSAGLANKAEAMI